MAPIRQSASATLPRNFTFHYTDGDHPRTPEPVDGQLIQEPPRPPRQTFRIRRRRQDDKPTVSVNVESQLLQEMPIPTIETSEAPTSDYFPSYTESLNPFSDRLLSPMPIDTRDKTPPRTPLGQTATYHPVHGAGVDWSSPDWKSRGESISRPSTACSNFSDSSLSSSISMESFPSFGGSCTSPDSEIGDYVNYRKPLYTHPISSPLQNLGARPAKRLMMRKKTRFTAEMDNHLWFTYMVYLQDPTVTPFKMLPGTAPPLGVCHRVVREAKKSWKEGKVLSGPRNIPRPDPSSRLLADSPDTIKPATNGSWSPTVIATPKLHAKWPRSDAATRRRFRELCKRKPTLSAHYQRMLMRSPSPFTSSSPQVGSRSRRSRRNTPFEGPSSVKAFSTRDMNVSLATSTSKTMQLGNPLAQLAESDPPRSSDGTERATPRPLTHQKSQSLNIGLGSEKRVLDSPFNPRRIEKKSATLGPATLNSPVQFQSSSLSRSFKRHAQQMFDDDFPAPSHPRGLLQDVFDGIPEPHHRRVRSRGFSLGDMTEGPRNIASLFTPPSTCEQPPIFHLPVDEPAVPVDEGMADPAGIRSARLGSPFMERQRSRQIQTFPRNFFSQSHPSDAPGPGPGALLDVFKPNANANPFLG
ncbi:hypothetical protein P152DRAFT_114800 [Eremomyces bilateralis CBS 781.70]|uniref:Uncharacterized protein n=1 Tax=Eremomyces bilateralis CBS 781.70 TaxID=1392243 RepID=A0A6G1GEB4_9PEZI|nr:uncharacterized protein P152DRAFT_114800 [Eremomyces bilateralis CBS 781.70]KAF1816231.1 hypothetical protein P152DRAFT_114800 [Eremomyces bilateralis CBS 781.70]